MRSTRRPPSSERCPSALSKDRRSWWTGKQHTPEKFVVERAQRAQDEYISKLRGIALVGLEGRQTPLAKLALKELKAEFAARVGTRIKTKYARWLAFWSGLVSVGLLLVYCFLQYKYPEWKWGQDHRIFLLAAMGAAIGAWLSFSIRQVEFVFEDLLLLEDDASDPPLRIAFVVILTWTAFLLFWLGAINVEVGGISTKPEVLKLSGTLSVLIGIFFGLSERVSRPPSRDGPLRSSRASPAAPDSYLKQRAGCRGAHIARNCVRSPACLRILSTLPDWTCSRESARICCPRRHRCRTAHRERAYRADHAKETTVAIARSSGTRSARTKGG